VEGERSERRKSEVQKVYNTVVRSCKFCKGSGMDQNESLDIEKNIPASVALADIDDYKNKIRIRRKSKFIKSTNENPENVSYGFCKCYKKFDVMKSLLIGDIPLRFLEYGPESILAREVKFIERNASYDLGHFLSVYLGKFPSMKHDSIGMNFFGKFETGKTFVAQYLAAQIAMRRYSVHYVPFFMLAEMLYHGSESPLFHEIMNVDFLVIDDIGNEHKMRREFCGEISYWLRTRGAQEKITVYVFEAEHNEPALVELYGASFYGTACNHNMGIVFTKRPISKSTKKRYFNRITDNL
jgi:hypothetical protein